MERRGLTDEEILRVLRETESGDSVATICGKHGISHQTFYSWRKKYLLQLSDVRARNGVQGVQHLREENARLRELVASLSLDRQILKEMAARRI